MLRAPADALQQLDLPHAAAAAFSELALRPVGDDGKEGVTVKIQCNEGSGGCFPMHFDNAGPPSKRKLSDRTSRVDTVISPT